MACNDEADGLDQTLQRGKEMKDTPYFQIFGDAYTLMKSYYPPKDHDEYWQSLLDEANDIYKRYQDTEQGEFVKALVVAVSKELERVHIQ